MEFHNSIGHGFHEKPCENALAVEFRPKDIPYIQQPRYIIEHKSVKVGEFIPDLIAYEKIIIDTKVIEAITDHEIGQMLNYLKITGLRLGYVINFKHPKLLWKRVVN